jgi:hypothetical protein
MYPDGGQIKKDWIFFSWFPAWRDISLLGSPGSNRIGYPAMWELLKLLKAVIPIPPVMLTAAAKDIQILHTQSVSFLSTEWRYIFLLLASHQMLRHIPAMHFCWQIVLLMGESTGGKYNDFHINNSGQCILGQRLWHSTRKQRFFFASTHLHSNIISW